MTETKPFAFVLMPFHGDFDDIYSLGIKQACSDLGIVAERVDEQFYSEGMLDRIYRQIEHADFIIADMTGQNSNVFYEVGYAHAKEKPCALITQKAGDIPFDLQHHFHIVYDGKIGNLKAKLSQRLKWMKDELEKAKKETLVASVKTSPGNLAVEAWTHDGEFDLKFTLKNVSKTRSPEIDNITILTSNNWRVFFAGKECPSEVTREGTKRSHIPALTPRLASGALSQTDITLKRTFWSKWSGEEKEEAYKARGTLEIEVATEDGILPFSFDLDVEFDEIPF